MGTYLVTGATGFLGSNVMLHLVSKGHCVVACDLDTPGDLLRRAGECAGDVRWLEMDVADPKAWARLPSLPYRAVVHTAAITASEDDPNPRRTAEVNLMSVLYAMDWAVARNVPRFVFTSSSAVYRHLDPEGPMSEDFPVDPDFTYGITKRAAERFVSTYRDLRYLDACSVRLPSMYGPWEHPTDARRNMSQVYHLVRAALRGEPTTVSGATAERDWTYVGDAAEGLAFLADQSGGPDLLNLSTGRFVMLEEILRALDVLVPDHAITQVDGPGADIVMTGTSGGQPMDVSRITRMGFQCKTSIELGLEQYIGWLQRVDDDPA